MYIHAPVKFMAHARSREEPLQFIKDFKVPDSIITNDLITSVVFSSKLLPSHASTRNNSVVEGDGFISKPRPRAYTSGKFDFVIDDEADYGGFVPLQATDVKPAVSDCYNGFARGFFSGNATLHEPSCQKELGGLYSKNTSSAAPIDSEMHASTNSEGSCTTSCCAPMPGSPEAADHNNMNPGKQSNTNAGTDELLLSMENKLTLFSNHNGLQNDGSNNNTAASLLPTALAASASAGGCTKQHHLASAAPDSPTFAYGRYFSADQPQADAPLLVAHNKSSGRSLLHLSSLTPELHDARFLHATDEQGDANIDGMVESQSDCGLLRQLKLTRFSQAGGNSKTLAAAAADISSRRAMLMQFFEQGSYKSEFLPSVSENHAPPPSPRRTKSLRASALRNSAATSPTGKQKIVRFADALGLELSEVKIFFQAEIPDPLRAGGRLMCKSHEDDAHDAAGTPLLAPLPRGPSLLALFSAPGLAENFIDRVRDHKFCLESIAISDTKVDGSIRVLNVAFNKEVFIRYTLNEWQSTIDKQALFSESKSDGLTDRFTFTFYAPPYMWRGAYLEFCLGYRSGGGEWWDNNYGRNYRLECFENL